MLTKEDKENLGIIAERLAEAERDDTSAIITLEALATPKREKAMIEFLKSHPHATAKAISDEAARIIGRK